jgi:tripartite-type tricarboxylate transporter receptor subunit TctC
MRADAAHRRLLVTGDIRVPTASSLEYVRAGQLRALAVTIERRLDALPDIPAVAEFVPGYDDAERGSQLQAGAAT